MTQFLPNRDEINPRWFSRWGETFGSAELALQMTGNDRIFERMRGRMLEAFGINLKAELKQEDVWAAQAYGTDRNRLARICGMVIHGEFLRTCISKEDFNTIANVFSLEDLKTAVSLNHLHPKQSDFTTDASKIATLIERSGKSCIHAWKSSLEEEIGMRVYLMESDGELEEEITNSIDVGLANSIITAVSIALMNESNESPAVAA